MTNETNATGTACDDSGSDNSQLWNPDLAPTSESQRTWTWVNISALWIGMAVCVPAYLLASGLIAQGMSGWQAMATVLLGNLVVLVPMLPRNRRLGEIRVIVLNHTANIEDCSLATYIPRQ